MKMILALGLLVASVAAQAVPLKPLDIKSRQCQATVNEVTYQLNAVCWKNQNNEFRLWFPQADFEAIRETGINTKYIINTAAACATTNLYTYEQLFGETPLAPEAVDARPVQIIESQLDASACFRR